MEFVFLFLIAGLLCNQSAASALQKGETNDIEASNGENPPQRHRMRFIDLDPDVLYLILEQTTTMQTMNLLEAIPSQTISSVAHSIFRRTYKDYYVEIHADSTNYVDKNFEVHDKEKFIRLNTMDTILKFVKSFGGAIQSLELQTQLFKKDKAATISRYINEYGSDSLKMLSLHAIRDKTFEQFTKPFENVEELSFSTDSSYLNEARSGRLRVNQQFPKLRRLGLYLYEYTDLSFIHQEFSSLFHLKLDIIYFAKNQTDQVIPFLKKNQQISSVELHFVEDEYIRVINEMLPNLQSVNVRSFKGGNEILRFENVTNFVLSDPLPRSVDMLSLPRLESFEMRYSAERKEWNVFSRNHVHLERFHVKRYSTYPEVKLEELVANLSNLTVLTVECESKFNIGIKQIRTIFENHHKLTLFEITAPKVELALPTSVLDKLRSHFGNEWRIEGERVPAAVSFERIKIQ